MRLPQDRILHIDTEFRDGKVGIVAEWQGELVRCKDCRHYHKSEMYSYCSIINVKGRSPKEIDFCSCGERREP